MQEGYLKIDYHSNSGSQLPKNQAKQPGKSSKSLGIIVICLIVLVLFSVFGLILPIRDIYTSSRLAASTGLLAYNAAKTQDMEQTSQKLKDTETSLIDLQSRISKIAWIQYLPFIGVYEKDSEHFVRAGLAGIQAARITVSTVSPYSDLLGLKGKSTFTSGSADERIKTAVDTLDKVTPKLDEIAQKIAIVGDELDKIDPGRYPEKLGTYKIKNNLVSAKDIFNQTAKLFVEAQPFLKKIPDLLGNRQTKTYLVLFQNDAELRATGGFITAYGIFSIDKGKMKVVKADDIYKLDEAKKKSYPAPSPILKYHQNVFTFNLRDANLSPDYNVSIQQFEKMLNESVPDFPKYDGIIAVDTHVLVSAIKILGDFNVYGRVFSAENDKRCDCPKAIYELEDYATKPVAYVRDERKDIISVLLYQIMQRSLGISPSKYWGKLFQMFLDEAKQKHILFYFHDTDAQKGIEAVNFGGRVASTSGEYLHINDVNFAGAKSNIFVKESVKDEISLNSDGILTHTITISYKNPTPASNCNLEAGQLCLNGILRNWLRIYTPVASKLMEFKGSEKDAVTYDELGKTVFEGFLTVKPQGASETKIKYSSPNKFKPGDLLNLLIQKQPGTNQNEYTIFYNGREIDKFTLLSDKQISIKL